MDNATKSTFKQYDGPDERLFNVRWRYLALLILNTLVSLMLITNVFLTNVPASGAADQTASGRVPNLSGEEEIVIGIYEQVGAAVVKIVVAQRGQVDLSRARPQGDGVGSGLILDRAGHIVTNQHVVDGATDVVVQLVSGRVVKAEVVGQDIATDLALLHIDIPATDLVTAPFADSDALQVGQTAIAIGYPFGFDQTLTVGHISGLGREVPGRDKFNPVIKGMIQTDAAINPGNSGGPLLNLRGEVVGLNTTIFSTSRGSQGVAFALPSNTVQRVIARLLANGDVPR